MTHKHLFAALLMSLLLAACSDPSKSEIIAKAKGIDSKDKLEATLGQPDDLSKLGPLEKWTYKASDGQVTFIITGNTVALELAGGSSQD